MKSVRDLTINDPGFDSDPWSLWDAQVFAEAAALIRREIAATALVKARHGEPLV